MFFFGLEGGIGLLFPIAVVFFFFFGKKRLQPCLKTAHQKNPGTNPKFYLVRRGLKAGIFWLFLLTKFPFFGTSR